MVLSTATQLNSTYRVWKRFGYPDEKGTTDAIAVPKWVGDTLNPAYALIIDLALANFWTIFFGVIFYFYILRQKGKRLDALVPKIWNKRSDLISLVVEALTSLSLACPKPPVALILLLCLAGWVGQKATGILVPPLILVGNAAPVDPAAIYVPNIPENASPLQVANDFALEAPRFLRALGSTAAGEELRKKVEISQGTTIRQTDDGDVLQFDYKYSATGADMGLQRFPDLTFNVVGSCITEYGWYDGQFDDGTEVYSIFGNDSMQLPVSLYDGRQPTATFSVGKISSPGTTPTSNATWAAIISATDRLSFSPSNDPWYRTGPAPQNSVGAQYAVLSRRPALSCWEDNVWSYQGENRSVLDFGELPGVDLSQGLQLILGSVLGVPMIFSTGQHLQASALVSATTAFDQIFDAGSSSIHNDLERLLQAAYVATINCLTDLTLYPAGAMSELPNLARDDSGQPRQGIEDFVVWSPNVAALSTVAIIVIPSVFVGLWIFAVILLYWTPIQEVNQLDSIGMSAGIEGGKPTEIKTDSQHGSQSGTQPTPATTLEPEKQGTYSEGSALEAGHGVGNKDQ
ncbi:hypothetical protein Hte_007155 [Hypoxylon texense]